jgi:GNAT superfamily N-acetyltransferase
MRYFLVFSVYELPLERFRPHEPRRSLPLEFQVHTSEEALPTLLAVNPNKEARFRERLQRGCEVIIALSSECPIAYVWLERGTEIVEERFGFTIDLQPNEIYDFDSFVLSEFRGRGVLRSLHEFIVSEPRITEGSRMMVAVIETTNHASQRAYGFMGFDKRTTHCALDFLGWKQHYRFASRS